MPWKLTARSGSRVEHARFDTLDQALDALEQRALDLSGTASRDPIDAKLRRFEPVQQVAARIELAGPERMFPSTRGGVDVRGDGSIEAYLGRVRRRVVEQRKGETSYAALRRALNETVAR